MKKRTLCLVLCLMTLTACGGRAAIEPGASEEVPVPGGIVAVEPGGQLTEPADANVMACRIVDGAEEGSLLLAGEGAGELYRLTVGDKAVMVDGQPAAAADLKDGMLVEIFHSGGIMESYPAQFSNVHSINGYSHGSERDPGGTYYDLCGFYLKVLDDLWQKDYGLNENITVAGLDLSNAPGGLTEGEKAGIAWRFGELHGVWIVEGTLEELKEAGYLAPYGDTDAYWWEDGCLFAIEAGEWEEGETYSLPVLKFDAHKWRSPLGAYWFSDCFAVWPQMGTWSEYTVGAEMIA